MTNTNFIDALIARVSKHISWLKSLNAVEIKAVIKELKKEKAVWNKIASGNKDYLEKALKFGTDNYLKGAIPHLAIALPHRLGFIASVAKEEVTVGDPAFDDIITGKRTFMDLSALELIQFLRDFYYNEAVSEYLNTGVLSRHKSTVNAWVETYDRRRANKGSAEAEAYVDSKKEKIYNLFVKAILPNLMGAIARNELK